MIWCRVSHTHTHTHMNLLFILLRGMVGAFRGLWRPQLFSDLIRSASENVMNKKGCWLFPHLYPLSSSLCAALICSWDLVEIHWHQRMNVKLQPVRRWLNYRALSCCVHSSLFFMRTFATQTKWNDSNSARCRWCLSFSLCLSAARDVGLASRPERQSEGESNRERHAGSDHQSSHLTGRSHVQVTRMSCNSFTHCCLTKFVTVNSFKQKLAVSNSLFQVSVNLKLVHTLESHVTLEYF